MNVILGSANFGNVYGYKKSFKSSREDISILIREAEARGVKLIDTSPAYGTAQKILGDIVPRNMNFITKFKVEPDKESLIGQDIERSLAGSLNELRRSNLHGGLIHNSDDLSKDKLYKAINKLKDLQSQNLIKKIGISCYDLKTIELIEKGTIDIIQCPINLFDQRFCQNNQLNTLQENGVEIHARSIFLQGLLLDANAAQIPFFKKYKKFFDEIDMVCEQQKIHRINLALNYINTQSPADAVVVGFNNKNEISNFFENIKELPQDFDNARLSKAPLQLVDPRMWR